MVLADGCFDPLHWGHIRYLRAAAMLGRPVIVNIADDEAILAKGRQPFQTHDERAATVLALDMVDRISAHPSLAFAIRELKPRYLVKGREWRDRLPDDVLHACQVVGADIVYTDTQERTSTERLRL